MAGKAAGKLCLIKKNSTTIGGGRTVGMTVNGAPINVEDQGDSGLQTLIADVITGQSLELTIEGYEEDQVLRGLALGASSGRFLSDLTFEFPPSGALAADEISGDFFLSAYSETGALEDGQTFSATFTSDGAWTFTPGV